MIRRFLLGASLCVLLAAVGPASGRTVVDALDRTVEVPDQVTSVFASAKLGTILLYTIDLDCIAGLNFSPGDGEKEFLEPAFLEKPVLGGWFAMGGSASSEEILQIEPQLILVATFLPDRSDVTREQIARIKELLHIPVIVVDCRLEALPETYRLLGSVLSQEERTEELASAVETTLAEIRAKADAIPAADRVSVYYAEGTDGLMTSTPGSVHSSLIEKVGARNAVAGQLKKNKQNRCTVSPEQLLLWNPEAIIVYRGTGLGADESASEKLMADLRLAPLKAVRERRVYEIPCRPYNVTDHPPSVCRLLGLKWLGSLIYPEVFHYDMRAETRAFYRLFFQVELTDGQINEILGDSLNP